MQLVSNIFKHVRCRRCSTSEYRDKLLVSFLILLFLQNIGVSVVFFFDGITQEEKRNVWLQRRKSQIDLAVELFAHLNKSDKSKYFIRYLLPPIVGATGCFVAKFECRCNIRMSIYECDAEMADYAQQEGCFAILSRDTDFVLLEGACHYLSIEKLDMGNMTTVTYSREGLLNFLNINKQQLYLLASLLGNDIVRFHELRYFHRRFSQTGDIFEILPGVVEYIKNWHFTGSCRNEDLRDIAIDVFGNADKADDLSVSIRSYLPGSGEENGIAAVNDIQVSV